MRTREHTRTHTRTHTYAHAPPHPPSTHRVPVLAAMGAMTMGLALVTAKMWMGPMVVVVVVAVAVVVMHSCGKA